MMKTLLISALILLPAIANAWPSYYRPSPPPNFSYPPITINIPSISVPLPPYLAGLFGFPTDSTSGTTPTTDATPTTNPSATNPPATNPPATSGPSPFINQGFVNNINANNNNNNGNTAGSLSVQHATGSPSVSYNGNSAVIQADMEISQGASATCTLRRGNQEVASKDCSSGSFSHRVREEGNYTLRVSATDSNDNRVIDAKNVRVDFD